MAACSVEIYNNNNNNNNNDFISKALFHVKHAQLRCTMPMNNTHTHTHTHTHKIYFILDPHEKHMGLCNQSCSSGWLAGLCLPVRPSVLPGKIFNTGYYMQTFLPIFFFIPAFCLSGCLASQPSYLVKAFVLNITDRLFKFCYTCCAHSYC